MPPAVRKLRARKARLIALHPGWHVARHRVLPRTEPEQHDASLVRACLFEQAVDRAEIELPFDRLDQFPEAGARIVLSRACRTAARTAADTSGQMRGVAGFAAADQERRAIDDQLLGRALGA